MRSKTNARINQKLIESQQAESNYWRAVLTRVIDVLIFLSGRGLALRGSDETIGSIHNGNFLGIVELLSKYDSFLAAHLAKYANKGHGSTSYLSHSICDELLKIMAKKVTDVIVQEMQEAKYFSISVDSTPDITHVDQLSVTTRYVRPSGPVERFMTFVPISSHTGADIADIVLKYLKEISIDIKFCRGQSYDNASNMSGKYKGVQQRKKCACKYAEYCPCCAHSLNLVGTCAAESIPEAASLFSLVQNVYTFFSASTKMWKYQEDMLANHEEKLLVVKKLSDTRWSARHDAVRALTLAFKQNIQLFEEIAASDGMRATVQAEARGLIKKLTEMETAILLHLWNAVLERVNITSVSLQKEGCPLNRAVLLLNSLLDYIQSLREKYDKFEKMAREVSGATTYRMESSRQRRRTNFFTEWCSSNSETDSPVEIARDFFQKNVYLPIIDQLTTSLRGRIDAYSTLNNNFGFLQNITSLSTHKLEESARKLVKAYPEDLEKELEVEIVHFASLIKGLIDANLMPPSKLFEIDMFLQIIENELEEAFPNVTIMFKIYLCMFVTNCKGERSFSKLKLLKNHLRNTMGQDRLAALAILAIENELLKTIDFSDIISTFADQKSRRKAF